MTSNPPQRHGPDSGRSRIAAPPPSQDRGGFRRLVILVAILVVAIVIPLWPNHMLPAARRTLGIFLFACLAWITEVLPIWVTGGLVVAALAALAAPVTSALSSKQVLGLFASPVVVLFAGGYFLAAGLHKHGLDRALAAAVVSRSGHKPRFVLAGMMAATAFLSMWMSNTAATALMISVVLPMVEVMGADPFAKALILGVPFAANVGGMATPVGTPPNAIAMDVLTRTGSTVSFLDWVVVGLPAAIILTIFIWWLLCLTHRPKVQRIVIEVERQRLRRPQMIVIGTLVATVVLWLTTSLHHVSSGVCALLPPAVFFSTGILDRDDLKSIGWDVLVLMAGGIALGVAMQKTGLSAWFMTASHLHAISPEVLVLILAVAVLLLSTFMSNTSAANVVIPLAVASGAAMPAGAMLVAFMASSAMSLPVSTPPNAIAYGTGFISSKDLMRPGMVIGALALAVNWAVVSLIAQ
ncbi:MAG: DASS family sodium-coupled anion symporter [Deltaproteobacteria bacterium]|nr:DASS family sodium-coupled anion symporter [Deltaproteobacteria bacterium]